MYSFPPRHSLSGVTLAAALATVGAAAPARAQHQLDPVHVVGRQAAKANALHEAAVAANTDPRHYRKVADMHLHSAYLRTAADAQAPACLSLAGNLLYFAGDLDAAQRALEESADRSETRGDVAASANALIDAGLVARARRQGADAEALGARAEKLAASPLMTAEQRTAITRRLERASAARTADASDALLRAAMRER
ncbi:MAG: hypothetical protein ACJ79S_14080 [Gemmatimonadaceae bacterium]